MKHPFVCITSCRIRIADRGTPCRFPTGFFGGALGEKSLPHPSLLQTAWSESALRGTLVRFAI
ncbi:MAG: hypothetical protein ACLTEX_10870, partial [Eggerthella lenta]